MPSDDLLNCESEGVLGSIAGIVGNIQANEVLKEILNIGKDLKGAILILNLLSLNLRKVNYSKKKIVYAQNNFYFIINCFFY